MSAVLEAIKAAAVSGDIPRFVTLIFEYAVSVGASDIHIEPKSSVISVRLRTDGVLKVIVQYSPSLHAGVVSKLKIMSNLKIDEQRIPQDGRLSVASRGKKIDLRVSCLPTVWGEKIVMRILDNTAATMALPDLGFSPENLKKWRAAYERPYGMLIVSGPTGSGKSTSLYATLHAVSRPEVNIVTVEDPVEYRIPGINQVQTHAKAGLTFAAALRSILRADPDIILIGEIRDHETAQIAIESALTGHLVLTTLHTNDAPSVITRLTEMGVEPFLVGSALECATGQRLARRLCVKCRRQVDKSDSELAVVNYEYPPGVTPTFYEPVGCTTCANTGYRGRLAMHEVMPMTEEIGKLALRNASSDEVRRSAVEQGMRTLRQDGWLKVAEGLTTIGEVLRVIA